MGVRRAAIALAGVILALLVAITVVLVTRDDAGGDTRESDPPPRSPSPAVSASPTPVASPSSEQTPTPSDLESPSATPTPARSAEDTVSGFVEAWLTTDPDDRETQLRATAVPHLADLLMDTDPESIPDADPDGAPRETTLPPGEAPEHSEDARRYRQDLSDGTAVHIDIVPDPDRGWLAAAITPAE